MQTCPALQLHCLPCMPGQMETQSLDLPKQRLSSTKADIFCMLPTSMDWILFSQGDLKGESCWTAMPFSMNHCQMSHQMSPCNIAPLSSSRLAKGRFQMQGLPFSMQRQRPSMLSGVSMRHQDYGLSGLSRSSMLRKAESNCTLLGSRCHGM